MRFFDAKGGYMVFRYEWSNSKDGNYAIRRKDTKSKPAGKEIEVKTRQTSDTHFFIRVNKNDVDTLINLRKINEILKTVSFEYVCKETVKKPLVRYLTKKDIDSLFQNIEGYKNKTVKIETYHSQPNETAKKNIKTKLQKMSVGFENLFGIRYDEIIDMLKESVSKEQGLKKAKKETETRIKKINAELKQIKNGLSEYESTVNTARENLEKMVFNIMKKKLENLEYASGKDMDNFQNVLEYIFYPLARKEMKREAGNIIQKRYRQKKSIESGKPKRKAGIPKKEK